MKDFSARGHSLEGFGFLACGLVIGLLLMSRSFAHWGIRPFYISEMVLGAFVLLLPESVLQPLLGSLIVPSRLSAVSWALALSLTYGLGQCLCAITSGSAMLAVAEIFVFHVYPLFLLIGIWVGTRQPDLLPRLVRFLAWAHGLYGLAYIGILSPLGLTSNLDDPAFVGWFGQPQGCTVVLLGLLAFEPRLRRFLIPFGLNVMVLLGMQRRAEWISVALGITLWAMLAGRVQRLLLSYGVIAALLIAGLVTDVRLPSPMTRGGEISTRDLLGRALAGIDPTAAEHFNPDAESHAGTVSWRSDFWDGIWREIHHMPSLAVFGLGYGYPIWQLHPQDLSDAPVRSPHSAIFFALGYSGWSGLLVYVALQAAIGGLVWRIYRRTGEPFGLCFWVSLMVASSIDIVLESPFGAIPPYFILGLAIARGTGSLVAHDVRREGRILEDTATASSSRSAPHPELTTVSAGLQENS
jgi:hypothetical protein